MWWLLLICWTFRGQRKSLIAIISIVLATYFVDISLLQARHPSKHHQALCNQLLWLLSLATTKANQDWLFVHYPHANSSTSRKILRLFANLCWWSACHTRLTQACFISTNWNGTITSQGMVLFVKPWMLAETLGDPYIRGLPLPRIPLSRELQPDAGQTVSVQPIAERTPRARLTRLLNGHTKIMRGLE